MPVSFAFLQASSTASRATKYPNVSLPSICADEGVSLVIVVLLGGLPSAKVDVDEFFVGSKSTCNAENPSKPSIMISPFLTVNDMIRDGRRIFDIISQSLQGRLTKLSRFVEAKLHHVPFERLFEGNGAVSGADMRTGTGARAESNHGRGLSHVDQHGGAIIAG